MIKGYPDVPTETSPEIIIGVNNADLFKRHYKATYKTRNNDQFKDAVSSFELDERKKVAVIYKELRTHGFYPVDMDDNCQIVFATRTRNIVLDESPMSKEEVKAERKRIRESVTPMVDSMPEAKPWDYDE
jgi:hypothetical protein